MKSALALLVEQPAMIKRPVIVHNGQHHLGFKAAQYDEILPNDSPVIELAQALIQRERTLKMLAAKR